MTETSEEKGDTESNGRKRYSLKSFTHLLKDSDDSDNSNDSEESDDSEDEWNANINKKRKKSMNISTPVRTLKKKLAEKTRALRKSVSRSHVEPPKSQIEEVNIKTEIPILKSPKSENIVELEKTDTNVKMENNVSSIEVTTSDIKIKQVETITSDIKIKQVETVTSDIKIKQVETVTSDIKIKQADTVTSDIKIMHPETITKSEKPEKNKPVVLTYSTIKNSSNISPFLLNNVPSTEFSTPNSTFNLGTIISNSISSDSSSLPPPISASLPSSTISPSRPSISSSLPSSTVSPSRPSISSSLPSPSISPSHPPQNTNFIPSPRIRVKSNLQATSPFRGSSTMRPVRPVSSPNFPNLTRPRMRAPTPRTPPSPRGPRTPQQLQRSPVLPISGRLNRPSKTTSNSTPISHTQRLNSPSTARSRTTTNVGPALNFHDSNSLKNISPKGTVIYNGSNSVTITPKKVLPEPPPVQRKLFRNEIEGVIAVRHENGVMKYVVNLANGTHMPLTDLQVTKLREQNGGRLPPKLRIPVPSDVAAKIEPSYLIED